MVTIFNQDKTIVFFFYPLVKQDISIPPSFLTTIRHSETQFHIRLKQVMLNQFQTVFINVIKIGCQCYWLIYTYSKILHVRENPLLQIYGHRTLSQVDTAHFVEIIVFNLLMSTQHTHNQLNIRMQSIFFVALPFHHVIKYFSHIFTTKTLRFQFLKTTW